MSDKASTRRRIVRAIPMAAVCFLVIAIGAAAMAVMAAAKKPPARKEPVPKRLAVAAIPAEAQAIGLTVTGYGQADPVRTVEICPEVSGKIIEKHMALDPGGMVKEGEVLFRIDDTDYRSTAVKADIRVRLQGNKIDQLRVSWERDQGRLDAVRQNTALAEAEYLRLKSLYEKDRVGTLSAVEAAEQSYNSLLDTEKNLVKTIALYPLQTAEAKSNLADARADLKAARLNVERCTVRAPFAGRVKETAVETGTYMATGSQALTLADDSLLEIQVPLGDRDAFEVLGLRAMAGSAALLSDLDEIACRVETVTGNVSATLAATVDRVVKYDAGARTLYLAARVSRDDSRNARAIIPLMDGMFCKVQFNGKSVREAVKIPASAYNPDSTVYLARGDRLKIVSVRKVMEDGDHLYVSADFEADDRIITTPLVNPMENTRLNVSAPNERSGSRACAAGTGGLL